VVLWVTTGRPATAEAARSFSKEGLERGRAVARDIVERGRAGASSVSGRWERLRAQVPGLRRRKGEPPAPPPLPPAPAG
jgi:hypothetical protein